MSNKIFLCDICKHNNFFSSKKKIIYCMYCYEKTCDDNKCEICVNNRFKNNKTLTYNNEINKTPLNNLNKKSKKKYFFKCNEMNHVFKGKLGCKKCPYCKYKTEKILKNFLIDNNFNTVTQLKFENKYYDYVVNNNIVIELDGEQHFKYVKKFKNNNEKLFNSDIYKMKKALENNYKFIRICQDDVWNSRFDWKKELLYCLNNDNFTIKYLSYDENKYNRYKNIF